MFFKPVTKYFVFKYEKILKPIMVWDEIVYLLTKKRLISDELERLKIKRYIMITGKCNLNPMKGCI